MPDDANIIERRDPRIPLAESILGDLGELRHHGMKIAREKSDQACSESKKSEECTDSAARSEPPKGRDPAEAFDRACRAVRVTLALEARVGDYLHALRAGDPSAEFWPRRARQAAREAAPSKPEPDRMEDRETLRGNVLELIDPDILDSDDGNRIFREIDERLYESERYDEFLDLPTEDAVEAICKDLGVTPQWESFYDYDWPAWRTAKTRRPAPPPDPADLQREEALWPTLESLLISPDDPQPESG